MNISRIGDPTMSPDHRLAFQLITPTCERDNACRGLYHSDDYGVCQADETFPAGSGRIFGRSRLASYDKSTKKYTSCQQKKCNMLDDYEKIVDELINIRDRDMLANVDIAKRLKVSPQYISDVLRKQKKIGRKMALKIIDNFDIVIPDRESTRTETAQERAEMIQILKDLVQMQKQEIERLQAEIKALQNPQTGTEGLE